MIELTYKEIDKKDKDQLKKLVDIIMTNLGNEQFFIPFEEQEYDDMFNKDIMTSIGAYDGNILVKQAKKLNMNYITAMAHPDNTASIKVIENFGLKYQMNKLLDNGFLRNIYSAKVSEMEYL